MSSSNVNWLSSSSVLIRLAKYLHECLIFEFRWNSFLYYIFITSLILMIWLLSVTWMKFIGAALSFVIHLLQPKHSGVIELIYHCHLIASQSDHSSFDFLLVTTYISKATVLFDQLIMHTYFLNQFWFSLIFRSISKEHRFLHAILLFPYFE